MVSADDFIECAAGRRDIRGSCGVIPAHRPRLCKIPSTDGFSAFPDHIVFQSPFIRDITCRKSDGASHCDERCHGQRTEHVHQMALLQYGAVPVDQIPDCTFRQRHDCILLKKPSSTGAKATKKALKPDHPVSERFGHGEKEIRVYRRCSLRHTPRVLNPHYGTGQPGARHAEGTKTAPLLQKGNRAVMSKKERKSI